MHGLFVFFCMFASFAGLLHVVSQEAAKSRVENVRAFARDVHAFGLFFDLIPKRRGSNIV